MLKIKNIFFILIIFFSFFIFTSHSFAFEITSDPQYIVINEADLKETLNWSTSQKEWEDTIKPKIIAKLRNFETVLTVGNPKRRLAWSVIITYMDYPLDKPSVNSPYTVMTRRILEIADQLNFPVFLPLNGFQWWNQLPELWNYWDSDGNQTQGCKNDEYDKYTETADGNKIYQCKFAELRDPEFRKRFIKGYNPANKWNVEWVDWENPMSLNWRDWGGGPFEHAPPPNIMDHNKANPSYHSVLRERYKVILDEIKKKLDDWEKKGKQDLFAGLSIGTEVSLNASIDLSNKFIPYGYRAIQDLVCDNDHPTCGKDIEWNFEDLQKKRQEAVYNYFNHLAGVAVEKGIPKQRVYTHVWSESIPGENRYTDYFAASYNLYSRPGLSLYGYGDRPFDLPVLKTVMENDGNPSWAAPEFGSSSDKWYLSLTGTLGNPQNPAKLVDIYNWREIINTPAIPAIQSLLKEEPQIICQVSEILPQTKSGVENPNILSWKLLYMKDNGDKMYIVISKYKLPSLSDEKSNIVEVPLNSYYYTLKQNKMEFGIYYWYVKRAGCDLKNWTISEPRRFAVYPVIKEESFNFLENLSVKIQDFFNSIRNYLLKKQY